MDFLVPVTVSGRRMDPPIIQLELEDLWWDEEIYLDDDDEDDELDYELWWSVRYLNEIYK